MNVKIIKTKMYVLSLGWRPEYSLMKMCDGSKGRASKTLTMTEGGLEKSGYIDVKQPQKLKGRKLKSWKKKWVVLQQMSNMSEGTYAAKIDVFPDEVSSYKSPSDKFTLFLENVTAVQPAKSKKHAHAFEIVENEPVLLMAGETELDSQTWVWTIRKVFWPNEFAETDGDKFTVAIVENAHTHRLSLKGVYLMTVTPETIAIHSDLHNSYEWSLNTLKRFNMEKDSSEGTSDVLAIECGPKSECGEAIFHFRSKTVLDILASIKKNIFLAISLKKSEKTPPCLPVKRLSQMDSPLRSISQKDRDSVKSITSSEQGIRDLLESPSKQAEKRFRLMSESSKASSNDEESVPNTNRQVVNEPLTSKTVESLNEDSNVQNKIETERRTSVDILSEPIETHPKNAKKESDYNKIDFKSPGTPSHEMVPIISTITVAKPGYQTNLLLDERGYSHVNLTSVKVQKDSDKIRSLSNNSNPSSASCRSASTGSRDSGILTQTPEKIHEVGNNRQIAHPSTSSFDSAVSTSSTVENVESKALDTKPTHLSVEIHEVEVTFPTDSKEHDLETSTEGCIYQDVSFEDSKSETVDNAARPKLKKSNSTGYFKTEENPYEELDKYRKGKKDLVKHLGMDPKVDPSSVPPSLPDRPMSHKMKRKFGASSDKKIFTLPFAKGKSRKNREKAMSSTSSESDSESGGGGRKKNDLSSMRVWPLGDTSIAGSNDFYQPIAIERFLNDKDAMNDKVTRERSCSLNLNRTPDVKRPSVSSANVEMRAARSRHGRNASLNVDILSNDPNIEPLFSHKEIKAGSDVLKNDLNSPVSTVPSSYSPTDSFDNDNDINSDSDSAIKCDHHYDEPVYAEVMPISSRGGEGEVDEPFPNLDEWKPQNMSDFQTNELDETNYENDESGAHSPVDLFNMGFVSKDENSEQSKTKTGVLIDLDTEVTESDNKPRSLSAFDIFNAANTSLVNRNMKHQDSKPSAADMNQAFLDIFSLGTVSPLPQSSTDLWNAGSQDKTAKHEQSAAYNRSLSMGENWADFSTYMPMNTGDNNWADFSQFESSQRETGNTVSDSIYMDMSNYKNESIYVMPSEAKRQ